ncbi:MAG: DUF4396 domain-containing protein [Verrucomicrobiota bacterium]
MKLNTLETPVCSMPEHGREAAPSACCRPSSPHFTGPNNVTTTVRATQLRFWADHKVWRIASRNTLNCLIGCMIGDLAVMLYMQANHPHAPMLLTMGLATAAGLVTSILFESSMLHWREGFRWRAAFTTAFSMSFLSMVGMELAANATDFMLTGGRVPFSDPFYWTALAISVGAGFLAPLPYNYWKFKQHGKTCH